MSINYKDHWENVYQSKNENQVSWYQKTPLKSIDLINSLNLARESRIIDVGAGESRLVDNLLILERWCSFLKKIKLCINWTCHSNWHKM